MCEAGKGLRSQPRIQTTWSSAVRRSIVVVGFIAAGVAFGDLAVVVGGAFGALQVGYADVGLPLGRLVRYLLVNTVAIGAAVFISATIGGTWWTVPWLIGLAMLAGALSKSAPAAATSTFNALVLGIVFSGVAMPPSGVTNLTLWILAGAVAQSIVWLMWWRWDRRAHVSLALANDLESVRRMVLRKAEFGMEVAESAGVEGALQATLRSAGMPDTSVDDAIEVASWAALVRRAAITWLEVADPSLREREELADTLRSAEALLRGRRRQAWQPWEHDGQEACVSELRAALAGLQRAVESWRALPAPRGSAQQESPPLLESQSLSWRHALRTAVAIGVAQAVSLPVSSDHSYWIPLTVAFILKPDWAYTLIRTILRLGGTIAAVLVLGYTAGWLIDHRLAYVLVAFLLVLVTLRWTSGNYAIAAFAVTGFILLIDSTLDRGPDLPLERLVFTVTGSLIGLAAALLVPTWVSRDVPGTVREAVASLRDGALVILPMSGVAAPDKTYVAGLRIRDAIERLRVVAVGTALEPRGRSLSTAALLDILDRGQLVLVRLWALGTYELMSTRNGSGPPVPAEVESHVRVTLDRACRDVGAEPDAADTAHGDPRSPLPAAMARAADEGFVTQATPLTADEKDRVMLLAAQFERDVLRLADSVRHLGLPVQEAGQDGSRP